eukprot:Polyplicarium_translucidae@DN1267_c0_g1_i2.p1
MFCCCAPAVAEEAPEMIQVQARGTIGQLEEWSHKNRLKRAETECARSENDRRRAQMSTERAALVRQKGELEEPEMYDPHPTQRYADVSYTSHAARIVHRDGVHASCPKPSIPPKSEGTPWPVVVAPSRTEAATTPPSPDSIAPLLGPLMPPPLLRPAQSVIAFSDTPAVPTITIHRSDTLPELRAMRDAMLRTKRPLMRER